MKRKHGKTLHDILGDADDKKRADYMEANAKIIVRVATQCTDKVTGKTGSFIFKRGDTLPFTAVSPIFPGLMELFSWLRENNYIGNGDVYWK